jgi:hypothetical protein
MAFWGRLRQARDYLRELRLSSRSDSYYQYKRGKDRAREEADDARERAEDSLEQGRQKAERDRGYQARYSREREAEVTKERPEPSQDA